MNDTRTVIAGTRPAGSCKPDGTHLWATLTKDDNLFVITKYDGWLIADESRTTSRVLADAIIDLYRAEFDYQAVR